MVTPAPPPFDRVRMRGGGDRRLDDRIRAAVDDLARALLVACWRDHAALFPCPAPTDTNDPALDLAATVLLGDRAVAGALRGHAEAHAAANALRMRWVAAAAHAHAFTPVDPVDALADGADAALAAAAVALRQAEAAELDPFGGPALPPAAVARHTAPALCALAAALRPAIAAADQAGYDRRLEDVLAADIPPAEHSPAATLVARLDAAGRLGGEALLDLLEAGHVRVWLAGIAHLLGRRPERLAGAFGDDRLPPALARILLPDPLAAARLLLLLARAVSRDDDRADALAEQWLDRFNRLDRPEAERIVGEVLRDPCYAAALARTGAGL